MLTQEEFMDVLAMRRQGLSIREIADATGYHPATISRWVKAGGPPAARAGTTPAQVSSDEANPWMSTTTGPSPTSRYRTRTPAASV